MLDVIEHDLLPRIIWARRNHRRFWEYGRTGASKIKGSIGGSLSRYVRMYVASVPSRLLPTRATTADTCAHVLVCMDVCLFVCFHTGPITVEVAAEVGVVWMNPSSTIRDSNLLCALPPSFTARRSPHAI
jgi:hypothetical protein